MIILVRTLTLLGATLLSSCVWWFLEPKVEDKKKSQSRSGSAMVPPHPLTWTEFVAANQGRGLTVAQMQIRFNAADANSDGLLTPLEIEHHRLRAALRKQEG